MALVPLLDKLPFGAKEVMSQFRCHGNQVKPGMHGRSRSCFIFPHFVKPLVRNISVVLCKIKMIISILQSEMGLHIERVQKWMQKKNKMKRRFGWPWTLGSCSTCHLLTLPISLLGGLWKPKCAVIGEQMEDPEAKEGVM